MAKFKANLITSVVPVSSGTAYTGKASGRWSTQDQVQAIKSSLWSLGIKAPTAPVLNSVSIGDLKLTANFTAPTALNGESVTNYTVTASPGGITASGTTSPIQVTGLTNNTSYTLTVVASSNSGPSPASNGIAGTPIPATIPGLPTITGITSAAAGTTTTATVTFTAPASNGGSTILDYTVTVSPGGLSVTGATSPLQLTGLGDGVAYTFTATARNIVGSSPSSTGFAHTTVAIPPTVLGQVWRGGYYGGILCANGGGTPTHYLVISDKTVGFAQSLQFCTNNTASPPTNRTNGPTNTTTMATAGIYPAASFCENLTSGGYTDWYMPAVDELQILYVNLKPGTTLNVTNSGYNANSYPVRSTNYTTTVPAQTAVTLFKAGAAQAFPATEPPDNQYGNAQMRSSTGSTGVSLCVNSFTGEVTPQTSTDNNKSVRAIRRVAYFV